MSKKKPTKSEPEAEKPPERKMRGWVGRKAGVEETSGSVDKQLADALKKRKKEEK